MAESDSTTPKKENMPPPIASRLTELSESRTELLTRIQGLKQDVQSWRSKLDTQVKVYRDELSELKKSLNVEVEQLRSDFQDLRTTLQQQQEDVTARLRKLGLQDALVDDKESPNHEAGGNDTESKSLPPKENDKETAHDAEEINVEEAQVPPRENGKEE